jgi:hypothetical protein
MSWNNALPFWIYQLDYEMELAKMSCAFDEEWFSGTSKVCPPQFHKVVTYWIEDDVH